MAFFSSNERKRTINLGGVSLTTTHDDLLAKAQQEREQRLFQKRAQEAASTIQARWRAHLKLQEVRKHFLELFDREPVGTIASAQFLVLGGGEQARLSAWATAALQAGDNALWLPFAGQDAATWLVFIRQIALMLLTEISHAPESGIANTYIALLVILTSHPPASVPLPLGNTYTSNIVAYLVRKGLFQLITNTYTKIPVDASTDPIHPGLVSLTLAPFIVLHKSDPEYRQALENFFVTVFFLPLYPNRLPKTQLPRLVLGIPFRLIHQVSIASSLALTANDSTALNLLANLIAFYPSRYPLLGEQPFEAYLELISHIFSRLPVGSLEAKSISKHEDKWVGDSDSDDDFRVAPNAMGIPLPSIDPKTAVRLRTLHSAPHLQSLMTASTRLPKLGKSVIKYLVNLCAAWPSKRDSILTTLSVNNGGMVIKQLWRETVRGTPLGESDNPRELANRIYASDWPSLMLLTELYNQMLLTMGDDEFFSLPSKGGVVAARNPLTLDEVLHLSRKLLNIAFALYWTEEQTDIKNSIVPSLRLTWEGVRDRATKCLQAVHARHSRRPLTNEGHWLMTDQIDVNSFIDAAITEERTLDQEQTNYVPSKREMAYLSPRLGILNNIPFTIPFVSRVSIFRSFIANDKRERRADGLESRQRDSIVISRKRISQDGFDHLNNLSPEGWKGRLQIKFIDQWGQEEAGIDGGGVFKEFLTALSKEVFDTDRGLWLATTNQELYPNPHSYAKEAYQLNWYRFIGRVLGKALYEGILVDVAFAGFFLAKWLGKQSYLDDLVTLDPELYKGLVYLKNVDGPIDHLALNFAITHDEYGVTHTFDLILNGSTIPVTQENKLQYIYLVSHYRLTRQIKQQSDAFFEGLSEIVNPKWLRMFNQQELRQLVGGTEVDVDVDDLKRHTVYGGLFDADHPTIKVFWKVVGLLTPLQRKELVRFVTSCSRPPLLGFKELHPNFAIRDSGPDQTRFPTASTCVNLLKLPLYQDERILRQKLIAAITSGAGFDLS